MTTAHRWTLVVGGGGGARFGGEKQFESIAGGRVLDLSVAVASMATDGVVVVVPADRVEEERRRLGVDAVVAGGASRSASVRAGLAAVPESAELILVHDAPRPLASVDLYARVMAAFDDPAVDAAIPVVPVTDTLRHRETGTVDRSEFVSVQTPQAFRAGALRSVHAASPEATDDAGLIDAAGGRVQLVDGDPANIKITWPSDLAIADALMRQAGAGAGGGAV